MDAALGFKWRPRAGFLMIAILAGALVPPLAVAQQAFKWTDANRKVHYGDVPPTFQGTSVVNMNRTDSRRGRIAL